MQQIFLIGGRDIGAVAARAMDILPVRAVGYRMFPLMRGSREMGESIHFLTATTDPAENDVICSVRYGEGKTACVLPVWQELAPRVLNRCLPRRAPILLDRVTAEALRCEPFVAALKACVAGPYPVVACLAPADVADARTLFPSPEHLWLPGGEMPEELLLERLQEELAMRM